MGASATSGTAHRHRHSRHCSAPLSEIFEGAQAERLARAKLKENKASEPATESATATARAAQRMHFSAGDKDPAFFSRRMVQQAAAWRLIACSQPGVENPLLARLTEFWFNHLNVYSGKGSVRPFTGHYVVHVARKHALGRFEDLLLASARHPAMLHYLDQFQSVAEGSRGANGQTRGLNENYARELMELHTLGVDGGYTQTDVRELARVLTGWTIGPRAADGFRFAPRLHDSGSKTVLGRSYPTGAQTAGEQEGIDAIRMLARHPATAQRVCTRLAQFFVADHAQPALAKRLKDIFLSTQGDLRAVLRALLESSEFWAADNRLFKTPMDFACSALAAIQTTTGTVEDALPERRPLALTVGFLAQAGQPLHGWQTPDGYRFDAATWLVPEALTRRADFALALTRRTPPLDFLRPYLDAATLDTIATAVDAPASPTTLHSPNRRQALQALAAASASMWAAPAAWAQTRRTTRNGPDGRLVVVFLRGAYDGLSALVPHGDDHYYTLRPTIAIPRPDGTPQSTIALDATFGLHPALAPLLPLWQSGVLGVIPAAGSPDPTRSHFDAQHHWETGIPGKSSASDGWMNTLAGLRGGARRNATGDSGTNNGSVAIGVGEANPLILAGSAPVQLVPRGEAAMRQGALGDTRTHDAVMKLYAGNDALSRTFRAGADSRMQTAETLKMEDETTAMQTEAMDPVMRAANNGAGAAKGLLLDARHLGTLMRQNSRLTLGFLSAGGWDTHANQGSATGALANNLGNLAAALVQLRRDFSQPNDVVLVCSEFGRTSAENGTRGTDHGHGNAVWLMGNRVQGGRWHGRWSGLANDQLHQGRDLPVHHDFRAVLAQVLQATQGVDHQGLDTLFPGYAWDAALDGVMRAY